LADRAPTFRSNLFVSSSEHKIEGCHSEKGGNMCLRNDGGYLPNCTAEHPVRTSDLVGYSSIVLRPPFDSVIV